MKYLLVLGLALGVLWLWRHNRQAGQKAAERPAPRRQLPAVEIVECAVCGVHLPKPDALTDAGGSYCCEAHRRQRGG